jgi:hypothetical protein
VNILRRALEEPLRGIVSNTGMDGGEMALVRRAQNEQENPNIGSDLIGSHYVDKLQAGIIDPTKVTRPAVQNAARDVGCCPKRIRVWRRRILDDRRSGLADRPRGTTADVTEPRRAGGGGSSVPYRAPAMPLSRGQSTIVTTSRGSPG